MLPCLYPFSWDIPKPFHRRRCCGTWGRLPLFIRQLGPIAFGTITGIEIYCPHYLPARRSFDMERRSGHSASRPIEYLLSGISSTSSIITRFIRSVRAAHADLSAVTRELSDLRLVLELLREEPSIPLILQAQMLLLLESCGNVLIQIDSVLDQCKDAGQWTKTGQKQMARCRVKLGTFREALSLALDILTLSSSVLKDDSDEKEARSLKEQIEEEIERLKKHGEEPSMEENEVGQVLVLFVDAVDGSLRQWEKRLAAQKERTLKEKEKLAENGHECFDSPTVRGFVLTDERSHDHHATPVADEGKEVVPAVDTKDVKSIHEEKEVVVQSNQATSISAAKPTEDTESPDTPATDIRYSAVSDTVPWISSRPNDNAYSYHIGEEDHLSIIRPEDHEPLPMLPQQPPREDTPKEVVVENFPESPTLPPQDFFQKASPLPTHPPSLDTGRPESPILGGIPHHGTPPPLTPDWGGNTSNEESSPTTQSEPLSPTNFLEIGYSASAQDHRWSDPRPSRGSSSSGDSYPHKKHAISRGTSIIDDDMLPVVIDPASRRSTMSFPRSAESIMESHSHTTAVLTPRAGSPAPSTAVATLLVSPPPDYRRSPTPSSMSHWKHSRICSPSLITSSFMSPSLRSPSVLSRPSVVSPLISPSIRSGASISINTNPNQYTIPFPAKNSPSYSRATISPLRHLADPKGKAGDILHIDVSPASLYVATRHAKNVKIWSVRQNQVQSTIKITSYVQPQVRSREYFIRSHAILSENASLIAVASHFGITLDIYNFSKGGTSSKKVQVIEEAHRWAASQRDAYHSDFAPLVVYRPKGDKIDRFFLARNPAAKKPFWEDSLHSIELLKSELPFVPKFPELAFSADSPFLVAAAGPRPGDPPRPHATILVAWHMKPTSEGRLNALSPNATVTSLEDETRHRPYRYNVPEYPALQTALPASLVARGNLAVSIWIPANHTDIPLAGGKFRRNPVPAPERFVVVWDLPANSTRIFAIPNVQACISPDCRLVAYCDANAGRFVIVDVETAQEVWRYPDAATRDAGFASYGQLEENLHKVTVFEFSPDGTMLIVGDSMGLVGVYDVKIGGPRYELGDGTELALADVPGYSPSPDVGRNRAGRVSDSSLVVPLGLQENYGVEAELP